MKGADTTDTSSEQVQWGGVTPLPQSKWEKVAQPGFHLK